MKFRLCSILVAVSLCSAQGFAQERPTQGLITRDKALLLAQQAAIEHGYNLKDYSHLQGPREIELMPGGKEWFFLYVCKRPAPGCAFSVTVNRASGATEVQPGE